MDISIYIDEEGNKHSYGAERITTAGRISQQFISNGFKLEAIRYFRVLPSISIADRLAWIERLTPSWLLPVYTHYNVVLRKL